MKRAVTVEKVDELLRFLPLFEKPNRAFVEVSGGSEKSPEGAITMPYPVYSPDVEEFFRPEILDTLLRLGSGVENDVLSAGEFLSHSHRRTKSSGDSRDRATINGARASEKFTHIQRIHS
jgi:Family of unknown function (DUF6508)